MSILIIINNPDHIPPLVTISTPSEDEHLSGIVTISFTATDWQGVIQERQIWIDSKIVNSTTGDTTHAISGSDHYTLDVYFNLI